jgi:probable rRNA maturation factor
MMSSPNPFNPITLEVSLLGEALPSAIALAPAKTWRVWLQLWLTHLAPTLSPIGAYEVSLQFTTDAVIAQLNADYRQQTQPTDVLSFAAIDNTPLPPEILTEIPFNLGDIVISVEMAEQQCASHGHTLLEEIAWLAAHGLLHLLGWDHRDETQLETMLSQQRQLLAAIGLSLAQSAYPN